MSERYPKLFEPWYIGNCKIPNRIILTPALMEVAELDGTAGDRLIEYYTERARGGVGLINTEVTRFSDWTGTTGPRQLSVTHDRCIPGLRRLADSIHAEGSKVFVQLHHPGRQNYQLVVTAWKLSDTIGRHWNGWWNLFFSLTQFMDLFDHPFLHHFYPRTVGASSGTPNALACSPEARQEVRALTKWEIHMLTDELAQGALRCKKAGIDGVEIHCAHGYLMQQFISPYTNHRTDEYGGSPENRTRIVKEAIDKIHKLCGPDYPISARFSADEYYRNFGYDNGYTIDDAVEIAKLLESYGIQYLDLSCGTYETMNTWCEPTSYEMGWRKENARRIKEAVRIPVGSTGVIRTPEQAEKLLEEGYQDVIGMARPLFADPDWANKAKEGRSNEINRCISCLYCLESMMENALAGGLPGQCAVNPRTCNEIDYPKVPEKVGNGRPVVVIGAGPSGLMAARTLTERGYDVTVFEKADKAGGQVLLAAAPPQKHKIGWITTDYETQCKQLGVKFRFGEEATYDNVAPLHPYAIFDASGAVPVVPRIQGVDRKQVYTPDQILDGSVKLKQKRVAVIGSGMTGLETAEFLSDNGNDIVVVEMASELAPGTWIQHKMDVIPKLNERHAELLAGWKLIEVRDDGVELEKSDIVNCKKFIPCDAVVLSLGVRPTGTDPRLRSLTKKFIPVGDAYQSGRIAAGTHAAYKAAMVLK